MPLILAMKKKNPFAEDTEEPEESVRDQSLDALASILGVPEKKKALGRALSAYMQACKGEDSEESTEEEEG
jgi:hypothetical protein